MTKKTEIREVTVFYCDNCGDEITGAMTIFNPETGYELHACHGWIEKEKTRCDLIIEKKSIDDAIRKQQSRHH